MKKLAFIFLILIAFTIGFTQSAEAWDSGCGYGAYSITTGQLCSGTSYSSTTTTTTTIPGCNGYSQYSTLTGQYCYGSTYGTTSSYTFTRELGIGSRGEDVVQYQTLLSNRGYSVGVIDGVFGSATRRATIKYQSANGLVVTGNGDTETLTKLSASGTVYPTDPYCPLTYVNGAPVYSCNTSSGVTVSGVSGPQSLSVYQSGTWTVSAYSQMGGTLSYSVDWGDQPSYYYGATTPGYLQQQTSTFTHSYSQAGTYTARFTVTNQYGQSAQTSLTVVVGSNTNTGGINIDTVSLPNGSVGSSYYATISASGTTSLGYSWSVTNGSLPPGLYLTNVTCIMAPCYGPATISGTPTTAGTYSFTVNVSSGGFGAYNSRTFTIVVSGQTVTAPSITSLSPSSGPVGTVVTVYGSRLLSPGTVINFDNSPISVYPISDSYLTFTVPSNITCSGPYYATGTMPCYNFPVTAGTHNVSITNTYGTSNTVVFTVTSSQTSAPTITSINPSYARVGDLVTIYGTNIDIYSEIYMGGYRQQSIAGGTNQVSFYVNDGLNAYCPSGQYCTLQYIRTSPGAYNVYVKKNGLTSNTVNLSVY